jgi:hypothetical protein
MHRNTISQESLSSKATADPARMPSRSRTFFGIVTRPLEVTVLAIELPALDPSHDGCRLLPLDRRHPRIRRRMPDHE